MNQPIDTEKFFSQGKDRPDCAACRYTDQCHKRVAAWNEAVAKFPNACQKCGGSGMIETTENGAPHGAGYWPMSVDDCCSCLEDNRCPRCNGELDYDNCVEGIGVCNYCGWTENETASVIPTEQPYCLYSESVYAEYGDLYE